MDPQQSRGRPTRRQLLWAGGIAALAFLIIIICGYLFGWKWTGFPKSTLWDWLDLLIVPAVLVIGGYLLTERQRTVDKKIADDQGKTDRHLADQRGQDAALQAYLDQMSQLILRRDHPNLLEAEEGDPVYTLAQARTSTVMSRLDAEHNASVIRFLRNSELDSRLFRKIALEAANLTKAELRGSDLTEADLRGADLTKADLRGANLTEADLTKANLNGASMDDSIPGSHTKPSTKSRAVTLKDAILFGANLERATLWNAHLEGADLAQADLAQADLRGANLTGATGITDEELEAQAKSLEGATMPNGQKYEEWLKDKKVQGKDEKNE